MSNYAFCTLVYGEKYIDLSKTLISQITSMGETIFVYTNKPDEFEPNDKIIVIPYTKEYFSFHEKITVVKECLKHYETAVFLDSDVVIEDLNDVKFLETITPGLHIFATFGNIGSTFCSNDINECFDTNLRNTKYGDKGIELLKKHNYSYMKEYHPGIEPPDYLEHFLEGKWILKKDGGKEQKFLEIWENLIPFCEETDINLGYIKTIGAGEGAVMSIACHNSGMTYKGVSPLVAIFNIHFISNYKEKMDGIKPWNIAG